MKILAILIMLFSLAVVLRPETNETITIYPGADENTPSRAQYFSWINNTNEGTTETHTFINLDFFRWLHDEYGMKLDIYAFDAGAIDGKRFYGKMDSDRFRGQFPNGFGPIARKAAEMGTRLGIWGGPDGFGDTREEEEARIHQMVSLCRDYKFMLFKFDAVCGPLRPEKEDAFIRMMTQCRQYSPDLILLNHRLGLRKAKPYATTFLWEGKETYIDVFSTNRITAPHHRADALSRGLPPDMKRLTEDHGVCISSCLDYWEDDLVLQAFNRNLILSPQVYGNPWLLRDDEFPKLARIYNLHQKYRDIMVKGHQLPEAGYGPHAVSRGNATTRLITLRNLTWEPVTYTVHLDKTIGLTASDTETKPIHVRQYFPVEQILGNFQNGQTVTVTVAPFRSCLLLATTETCDEPGITGTPYEVVRNTPGKPVLIKIKGMPGTTARVALTKQTQTFKQAILDNQKANRLLTGKTIKVKFPGKKLKEPQHRKLADLTPTEIPEDAEALYEATVYAADNNALEIRSLYRSGPTDIPQVKAARKAFLEQDVFKKRGIWDRNLFDGDKNTAYWPTRKYKIDQRIEGGSLRIDLGSVTDIDKLILHVPDEYSLQPLLKDEGNHVEISTDLVNWKQLTYFAKKEIVIDIPTPTRYLRFRYYPDRITEIEGYKNGKKLPRKHWRASNLFAHPKKRKPIKAWKTQITLTEYIKGSYLCIALEGEHGTEGAYAALKVNGKPIGCPDRASSYPSNTWEFINARRNKNYTYYAPITKDMPGKTIEIHVLAYNKEKTNLHPKVWLTTYPTPYEEKILELK